MTGESQSRPAQRMSRFSQAHRGMPRGGGMQSPLDERADHALNRADTMNDAPLPPWQALPDELPADVIEVEYETVPPLQSTAEVPPKAVDEDQSNVKRERWSAFTGRPETSRADPGAMQPPPPDIEAIAAALAAEMDRDAARTAQPYAELQERGPLTTPRAPEPEPPAPEPEVEAAAPVAQELPQLPPPPPAPEKPLDQAIRLARRAGSYSRNRAFPAIYRAGLWLARNLRRKEIRRRYGKALALIHGRVLDRRLEQHFYVPTLAMERFSPDPDRGILYEGPVPAKAFAWVLAQLPGDLREFAFVDFRAGRGRAMLLAAQRNFERIIGYEYDPAIYDDLQINIAQFPRSKMQCRDVQAFRGDRLGVSIPDQPCVLYVANAWREELLSGIMNYVRSSFVHKPRQLYVILENSDDKLVLPPDEFFHRMDLPLSEKLKLRLFSPIDFQLYRTTV
jgi:hypothetical protein